MLDCSGLRGTTYSIAWYRLQRIVAGVVYSYSDERGDVDIPPILVFAECGNSVFLFLPSWKSIYCASRVGFLSVESYA